MSFETLWIFFTYIRVIILLGICYEYSIKIVLQRKVSALIFNVAILIVNFTFTEFICLLLDFIFSIFLLFFSFS